MWLAIAVTVSLLSLPLRGSDPHRFSYLRVRLSFSPFSFPESSQFSELWHWQCERWLCSLFPPFFHLNQLQSSHKEAIFLVSSLNHLWDLISRHASFIIWSSGFLSTLSTLRMVIICCKMKQPQSTKGCCLFYYGDFSQSFVSKVFWHRRGTKQVYIIEMQWCILLLCVCFCARTHTGLYCLSITRGLQYIFTWELHISSPPK